MEAKIHQIGNYTTAVLTHESLSIDLGMLSEAERDDLAVEFLDIVWNLGPDGVDTCSKWLQATMGRCGITLPSEDPS
jgi:hypothetical protein